MQIKIRGDTLMKKCIALLLTIAVMIVIVPTSSVSFTAFADSDTVNESKSYDIDELSYDDFLQKYSNAQRPSANIHIEISSYILNSGNVEVKQNYLSGNFPFSLYMDADSSVTFQANVEQAGLYAVKLDYVAEYDRGADIERNILINGETQHSESNNIILDRLYKDKPEEIGLIDSTGNDIRPSQVEIKNWQNAYLRDPDGYYGSLLFYFEEGNNTITLIAESEPLTVGDITLCNIEKTKTYKEVSSEYEKLNLELANADNIILQGEKADYKSDPILYPLTDRTSPATIPYVSGKTKLNSIGADKWQEPNQFLVWEFDVEKSGLYTITIKERQNISRGVTSNRAIYIDGEIPFSEMENYEFHYNRKWELETLSSDTTEYKFYLSEGKHELKLEVTLGEMTDKIRQVEEIVRELNEIYTTIMIITGSSPDTMRDYGLDKLVPNEIERLGVLAEELQTIREWFQEYTGGKGSNDAIFNTVIMQLKKFNADHEEIPKGFSYFKTNIGSLSTLVTTVRQQPLEIDYIAICSKENKQLDDPNATFAEQLKFNVESFLLSFSNDYATVGSQHTQDNEKSVKVWINTGRDQAQVLRKLIDATFVSQYETNVQLELVTSGALLPATVAGIGPDVALNMGDSEPVNYALRDAVIDLTCFSDYEEVAARFLPERLVPLSFDGKVYALPETQTFNVLFYREDVLDNLGIEVPDTWEEVISVISLLQKNNMNFAIPVSSSGSQAGVNSYYMFLFQKNGNVYEEGGKSSALDSQIGLSAFKEWTNFFINYELPKEYNFVNRFRTGEFPLIVGDFSTFNTLAVSAPEIRGLWSFALVPGTVDEEGNINRSTPIGGSNCFILKNSDDYESAWNFIKWWTDTDAQVSYGKEMESIMGSSARHPTANLEAFEQIPWSKDFYNVLIEQMQWGKGIPQVPGSYFVGRHLDNAYRKVVISQGDVRETLFDYVYTINQEISGKRKEFGLE